MQAVEACRGGGCGLGCNGARASPSLESLRDDDVDDERIENQTRGRSTRGQDWFSRARGKVVLVVP